MTKVSRAFEKLNRVLHKFTTISMGIAVVSIFVLMIIQVFFRFVLSMSLGGLEELPVYVMAICVWLAAPFASMNDTHVNIDLIPNLFKPRIRLVFKAIAQFVAGASMLWFTKLAFDYVADIYGYGEVTGGLGIPIWIFHAVIFLGSLFVTFYSWINFAMSVKGVIKWKSF